MVSPTSWLSSRWLTPPCARAPQLHAEVAAPERAALHLHELRERPAGEGVALVLRARQRLVEAGQALHVHLHDVRAGACTPAKW